MCPDGFLNQKLSILLHDTCHDTLNWAQSLNPDFQMMWLSGLLSDIGLTVIGSSLQNVVLEDGEGGEAGNNTSLHTLNYQREYNGEEISNE